MKSNETIFTTAQPMIGDGYPMSVTTEISEHLLRAGKEWLGIDPLGASAQAA